MRNLRIRYVYLGFYCIWFWEGCQGFFGLFSNVFQSRFIFELGYLLGGLGRQRVCALYKEGVELPSDIRDVAYMPMDSGDDWKLKLSQDMRKAGLPVDMNWRK
ncbi:hypothetical protein C6500_05055 [Candidatus Poribacteria bacterium]|nr:MAG: hypothetical protein C6500_05055 [Candidatus Poribacteria bacterium]